MAFAVFACLHTLLYMLLHVLFAMRARVLVAVVWAVDGVLQGDPSLFEHYHSGFQQQTESWPQQPLELAAKW